MRRSRNMRAILTVLCLLICFFFPVLTQSYQKQEEPLSTISLIGIVLSPSSKASVAVLVDKHSADIHTLKVGEEINGYTLIHVQKNKVILEKEKKRYHIFTSPKGTEDVQLFSGDRETEKAPRSLEDFPIIQADPPINVIKKTYKRSEVESKFLGEWPEWLSEIQVFPFTKDGRIIGLKIVNIPEQSVLHDLNFRNNDIIKQINGYELISIHDLLILFPQTKSYNHFDVLIDRNSNLIMYKFTLK